MVKPHLLGQLIVYFCALAVASSAPAGAQAIAGMQVAAKPAPIGGQPVRARAVLDTTRRKLPRWPFVLVGAVAGGTTAGAWYARATAKPGDPMLHLGVPVVTVGVGVGALTGLIIGQVARHARAGAPAT